MACRIQTLTYVFLLLLRKYILSIFISWPFENSLESFRKNKLFFFCLFVFKRRATHTRISISTGPLIRNKQNSVQACLQATCFLTNLDCWFPYWSFQRKITGFKFGGVPYHSNFPPEIFKMAFKVSMSQGPGLHCPWNTPNASPSYYLGI